MTKKSERHTIASIGTLLFMLIVFLLLWFVRLYSVQPEEEEGVEIAFGEVAEAGGYMAQQSEAVPLPTPQPAAEEQPSAPSDNDLLTQEDEEALALRKAQEEAEKARRQAEAERLQKQREEQARLEAERKAREAAEAAEKAKQEEAIAKAGEWAKKFGNNNNADGSGDGQGSGKKGNPIPHGNRDGRIQGLDGRNLRDGKLPDIKECRPSTPCRVVVQIRVDKEGNVLVSSSSNAIGTNTGDAEFIKCVENALKRVKWTKGEGLSVGTITYEITQKMIDESN